MERVRIRKPKARRRERIDEVGGSVDLAPPATRPSDTILELEELLDEIQTALERNARKEGHR